MNHKFISSDFRSSSTSCYLPRRCRLRSSAFFSIFRPVQSTGPISIPSGLQNFVAGVKIKELVLNREEQFKKIGFFRLSVRSPAILCYVYIPVRLSVIRLYVSLSALAPPVLPYLTDFFLECTERIL